MASRKENALKPYIYDENVTATFGPFSYGFKDGDLRVNKTHKVHIFSNEEIHALLRVLTQYKGTPISIELLVQEVYGRYSRELRSTMQQRITVLRARMDRMIRNGGNYLVCVRGKDRKTQYGFVDVPKPRQRGPASSMS